MTTADLSFRITAELGEVKAALAALKQQLASIGGGSGFAAINAQLEKTPKLAADAAQASTKAARETERAARAAAAEQVRAAREAERIQRQAAAERERAEKKAADDAQRARDKEANFQKNQARQLAPQLTDIGVGLATGQSPLMVLLQQGGQLKDLYGGIVPALKAVAGGVAAIVTPVTAFAAVLGGAAIAYIKGADESLRFNRLLIETGNAAGVTTGQLTDMARQLDSTFGITVGSASDALAQVIATGKFAGAQVAIVARAAEQLRNSAGKDVGATVAEFAKIADDPVKGVIALNQQYNFLTGSTLARVRALQQQGRTQEAATVAARAYADAINERSPKIIENIGLIERAWKAVKDGAREAADAALNIGREETGQQEFDRIFKARQRLQDSLDNPQGLAGKFRSDTDKQRIQAQIDNYTQQLADLQNKRAGAERDASKGAAQKRAVQLQGELTEEAQQYETAAQRRVRLRQQITQRANDAIVDAETAGDVAAAAEIRKARDAQLAGIGRESAKSRAAIAASDAGLVRDSVDRAITEIDRLYDEGKIGLDRFLKDKAALQQQALQADIRAAQAELAAAAEPEDIARARDQLTKLERQKIQITTDTAFERRRIEKQTSDEVVSLRAQQLENEGKLEEAAALRFEKEFRDLRQRLTANGDQAGLEILNSVFGNRIKDIRQQTTDQMTQLRAQQLDAEGRLEDAAMLLMEAKYRDLRKRVALDPEANAIIDSLINTERAQARFNELRQQIDIVVAQMNAKIATIGQGVASGQLTPADAQAAEKTARDEAIAQITVLNQKLQELAERTNDPRIKQGARDAAVALRDMAQASAAGFEGALASLRASLAEMQKGFAAATANAGVDALTTFFTDIASGSKSAGDALKDFVRNFALSMVQIAAKALATLAVLTLLESIFPGAGMLVGASGSVAANVKHSGGAAGHGMTRSISPLAFAGAPRFHNGSGVLGLKAGEIPAILQTGEQVLSRDQVAAQKQGGGNGYRIVNVLDPSLVMGCIESSAGERAILNVISRNPAMVRQTIGS